MFTRITSTAVIAVLLFATGIMAQTTSGVISGTETWSGTVTVTGDVFVEGSLTIAPGTIVKFAKANDNVTPGTSGHSAYGGDSAIHLVVNPTGVFQANGTPNNRITFTSAEATPEPGDWGKLQIVSNGNKSKMSYCDFEYFTNALVCERPFWVATPVTGTTDLTVDHCTFTQGSSYTVYLNNDDSLTFSHCLIHDTQLGIFPHGAAQVKISHTTIMNVANAFYLAGKNPYVSVIEIDHLTMYNIDYGIRPTADWGMGYGIFCANDSGSTLKLTNSILYGTTLGNLQKAKWNVVENNNCFSVSVTGDNYIDGTIDTAGGSVDADPLFLDTPTTTFELKGGSPCLGTASDGSNMGVWQGVVAITDHKSPIFNTVQLQMHPVKSNATFTGVQVGTQLRVYTMEGSLIATEVATGTQVSWNRAGIAAGSYMYSLTTGNSSIQGNLIVTD